MKRATMVPPQVRTAFAIALKKPSVHGNALPDPLPMGRVLQIFDKTITPVEITRRGDLNTDEVLKVLVGKGEQGYFLDYFCTYNDNDGQTFWHGRIFDNGTTEALENYEGMWCRPYFPDDPAKTNAENERIDAHNLRVEEILRAKGFL